MQTSDSCVPNQTIDRALPPRCAWFGVPTVLLQGGTHLAGCLQTVGRCPFARFNLRFQSIMIEIRNRIDCLVGDITRERVDAIVNAANTALRGGGGVDGAIHRAAGPGLLRECAERFPDGCQAGEACLTSGHDLDASFVVHTPGPVYYGGMNGEPELLAKCYRNSLRAAAEAGCKTVAFPAISCGIYNYPVVDAARIALSTVAEGLAEFASLEHARFVLFNEATHAVFEATHRRLRL